MPHDLIKGAMKWTGLSRADIRKITANGPRRYKTYEIDKRSGGKRTIAQPSRELKELQYYLIDTLFNNFRVHEAAMAYVSGRNIKNNAEPHVHSRFILKMDFADFFGSVVESDFDHICKDNQVELSADDNRFCKNVLFYQPTLMSQLRLSIGAPSSPQLSNAMMFRFDEKIAQECRDHAVVYTRYADDLTFSCDNVEALNHIRARVPDILGNLPYPTIYVNWNKVFLVSKKYRRTVTGLTITNDGRVSLGRDRKRLIRSMIDHFEKGLLDQNDAQKLRGLMAFSKSVEPSFFESMKNRYGQHLISSLMSLPFMERAQNIDDSED